MKKVSIITIMILIISTVIVFAQPLNNLIANVVPFKIVFNGIERKLNMPIVAIDDRTYIPLREVSEILDKDVNWDDSSKMISICDKNFSDKLFPVAKNGKYGFINSKGEVKVDFIYVGAWEFSDGLALVRKSSGQNGQYGFINENGEEVIPCQYSDAYSFSDGVALVDISYGTDSFKGMYIDKNGNRLFDKEFELMNDFNCGYALVLKEGHGFPTPSEHSIPRKWAYIDKQGNFVNDLEFEDGRDFENGYARVKNNGKWGLIDTNFNLVIDYKYDYISDLENGVMAVYDKDYNILHYMTLKEEIVEIDD